MCIIRYIVYVTTTDDTDSRSTLSLHLLKTLTKKAGKYIYIYKLLVKRILSIFTLKYLFHRASKICFALDVQEILIRILSSAFAGVPSGSQKNPPN